ncbi:MAG TPA: efflux transporter outer membrane subunit [Steroidobacteraceae bacterium]|nr:efflux transporter outer membrane subunit [Steroidobacteraceae bacterium]
MNAPRAVVLGVLLGVAGCAAGPDYHRPAVDAPAAFAALDASGATPAPAPALADQQLASWWRTLGDHELDSLVERAITANPDLEIALTRLQQARTYEAVVLGYALPEVDASAAAGRGTGTDLTRGRVAQALVSADNTNGLQHINTIAGFDAVWELDVFGKYRREIEAARYDRQAAAAARNGVLTSVVADVVRAYVELRGFQTQAAILQKASAVLRESLRLVTIRYERGITNELDVTLAARELATLEAQIAPVNAQASAAQYGLAVLLGEYPETLAKELAEAQPIPALPEAVQPGVPVDLLKRRPDIQQAERELAGATARIGVATADLFPQIALVGAIGSQGQGWGTTPVVNKHIWSFGPGAIWPLLDFGTLDGLADIADLEAHARLAIYRRTILGAVQDVDTAFTAYNAEQDRLLRLGEGMLAGERAVELATERYERGLTDYLNVVDAERQFYDLQEQYVTAQVAEAEQFVQLYKSLGGGWENYQAVPAIRRPQPAIIAAFRRVLSSSPP